MRKQIFKMGNIQNATKATQCNSMICYFLAGNSAYGQIKAVKVNVEMTLELLGNSTDVSQMCQKLGK